MLKPLVKVPNTVLQDAVQRWYEKTGGNQKGKRRRRKPKFCGTGWKASPAEQSAEVSASPDMKGPVCTACRCYLSAWRWQEPDLEGSVSACRCWQESELEGRLLE